MQRVPAGKPKRGGRTGAVEPHRRVRITLSGARRGAAEAAQRGRPRETVVCAEGRAATAP